MTHTSTSSTKRLDTYSALARSLRKTHTKVMDAKEVTTGTLAVALPALLATLPNYAAQAQCRSTVRSMIGDAACSILSIDLDGDSVYDVRLGSYGTRATLRLDNTTASFSVLGYVSGFPFMNNLSTGFTVTAANPAFIPVTNSAYFFNPGNTNQFSQFSSGNIAFKLNGKLGLIDMSGFNCISVDNYGVNPTPGMAIQAGVCGTLPVELTTFKATAGKETIQLHWETASETNNAGFEIQRSTNGKQFHKIGWLDGNGTTATPQNYTFADDKAVLNQPYFYRLRQVDIDGSHDFSKVVKSVRLDKTRASIGDIFPNPTTAIATLTLAVAKESEAVIELYDAMGKKLHTTRTELTIGNNELPLDLSQLPKGTFFAKIEVGDDRQYRKIVKQ